MIYKKNCEMMEKGMSVPTVVIDIIENGQISVSVNNADFQQID